MHVTLTSENMAWIETQKFQMHASIRDFPIFVQILFYYMNLGKKYTMIVLRLCRNSFENLLAWIVHVDLN